MTRRNEPFKTNLVTLSRILRISKYHLLVRLTKETLENGFSCYIFKNIAISSDSDCNSLLMFSRATAHILKEGLHWWRVPNRENTPMLIQISINKRQYPRSQIMCAKCFLTQSFVRFRNTRVKCF